MKKFLFLTLLSLVLFSCGTTGEEPCSTAGCDEGYHCVVKEERCEKNCTDEVCEATGESCNKETGLCEKKSCIETGCNAGFICDEVKGECVADTSCRTQGCKDNFLCDEDKGECFPACLKNGCEGAYLCNQELGVCEPACSQTGCQEGYLCDENTQLCQPDESCRVVGCQDYFLCNEESGECYPACSQTGCQEGYLCDENTQLCQPDTSCRTQGCPNDFSCNTTTGECEHIDCTYGSCPSNQICNVYNGYCEAPTEYPTGSGVVANRTWTDTEGKVVSLKLFYNMYKKTGYPKAILLEHSAGWCSYCRQETPAVRDKYNASKTGNYHKLAVLQELCEDNNHQPATMAFARGWKSQYSLQYHVSTGRQIESFRGGVHPVTVIIDPKTMKIHKVYDPRDYGLTESAGRAYLDQQIQPLYDRN